MFREIDTSNPNAVRGEVTAILSSLFPSASPAFLHSSFAWVETAFSGRMPGYQPADTRYHDLKHTLEVTLCFARLLEGYAQAGAQPALTRRGFELSILAMLLHDTGYLKETGDHAGTGAKYTPVHVARSARFAENLLTARQLPPGEIRAVQNMIRCTGVNAEIDAVQFQDPLEQQLAFALATADLVGQMAAPDYVQRLGFLFEEFAEATRAHPREPLPGHFETPDDLRRRTPSFWQDYVLPRINDRFGALHQYLARPAPGGPNEYLERVQRNLALLRTT